MLKAIAARFRVAARSRVRSAAPSWPAADESPSLDVVGRRVRRDLRRIAVLATALATIGLVIAMSAVPAADPKHPGRAAVFSAPQYYPALQGDSFYNTTGPGGEILITSDDSRGVHRSCTPGGTDIGIFRASGSDPANLRFSTVNCMRSFRPEGSRNGLDGCTWKNGGITRIGHVIYLAVARQLHGCSRGKEAYGLQPSFDASIIKSTDGGRTWTNAWGTTSADGAAPPWESKLHRYRAMFPGQTFTVPFFIQYGPGNTHTVDGANKYLYAVSTDGYAYNGSFLELARVPLHNVLQRSAWQFYHGSVGGTERSWSSSPVDATHILQAKNRLSQPVIQYVPALRRYVMTTFYWSRAGPDFPTRTETPYSRFEFFTSPKPWGPWTKVFEHTGQRSLWCAASPCQLVQRPRSTAISVGKPDDWLGLFDPALVQKFVFTKPLSRQAILTDGDWKEPNRYRYRGEDLHMLHVIPLNLAALPR